MDSRLTGGDGASGVPRPRRWGRAVDIILGGLLLAILGLGGCASARGPCGSWQNWDTDFGNGSHWIGAGLTVLDLIYNSVICIPIVTPPPLPALLEPEQEPLGPAESPNRAQ
jgi:hypothetical protein